MNNMPEGRWYTKVDGVRFEGNIWAVDCQINCQTAIWTLRVHIGHHMIDVTAPRTAFRKVDQ